MHFSPAATSSLEITEFKLFTMLLAYSTLKARHTPRKRGKPLGLTSLSGGGWQSGAVETSKIEGLARQTTNTAEGLSVQPPYP